MLIPSSQELSEAKVLLVGAGGIGCELLKNLVLSGITNFVIVDLDMIDVSNLNRQFLFGRDDVGKSKAEVAAKAVRLLVPDVTLNITCHVGKVQDLPFSVFEECDIVFNALDNFEARRYVNRVCMSAKKPLIDSGSTGFNGQVFPVWSAAKTECFECRPQPRVKSYPVCTIRLTPDKPEHCIAWARSLCNALFAPSESDDGILADLREPLLNILSQTELDSSTEPILRVCQTLFVDQINDILKAREFSENERKPHELAEKTWDKITSHKTTLGNGEHIQLSSDIKAQELLPLDDHALMFADSLISIIKHRASTVVKFDKDDDYLLGFVAAAASLRMANYDIPAISLWEIKTIAGAIQPAIAATNATVAALQSLVGLRMLKLLVSGKPIALTDLCQNHASYTWVRAHPAGSWLIIPENLENPNSNCFICQQKQIEIFFQDLQTWTIGHFLHEIMSKTLEYKEFDKMTVQSATQIIYDEDLLEDNPSLMDNPLPTANGEVISVTVMGKCAISFDIRVREDSSLTYPDEGFIMSPTDLLKEAEAEAEAEASAEDQNNAEDSAAIDLEAVSAKSSPAHKRPRSPTMDGAKKPRLSQ